MYSIVGLLYYDLYLQKCKFYSHCTQKILFSAPSRAREIFSCERSDREKFANHLEFFYAVEDWREKEIFTEGVNDTV